MKSLVIFDLDGTLLNTIDDLGNAVNYALEQHGFPTHMLASYPYMVGNGVTKLIERALPDSVRNEQTITDVRRSFRKYYDLHTCDCTKPYPGIPELLDDLTAKGIKLAVASNKYQEAVTKLVTHFFPNIPWAAIHGHRDGIPTKPDPSIVFNILTNVPTPKSEVLYVGDSGVDIETARRACVESAGVTWGFRPESELRQHYAEHIAGNPDDILRMATRDSL